MKKAATHIYNYEWQPDIVEYRPQPHCVVRRRRNYIGLVGELSFDKLTVEACNVEHSLILRTNGFTSTRVGAVTETEFVHLANHSLCTLSSFYAALGQQRKLAELRTNEEHCRTILAGSNTSAATNTSGAVHCFIG